jgi:SAM-dependent methyltransferase
MKLFPNPKRNKIKLLEEFKGKKVLDLTHKYPIGRLPPTGKHEDIAYDLTHFPWPIHDNFYDLIICQHVLEHLPDTAKTLEELNRIAAPGAKILIETPHFTWFEAYRNFQNCHRFSLGSFDYFIKGNPFYKTDFHLHDKYLFFDDFMFLIGIGFLANLFPRQYEKRLAFIFPATSFQVTFRVEK